MNLIQFTQEDIELIIDSLEHNLNNIDKFDNTYYFDSYFEFLKYFENKTEITYHDLVISSHFTYGWMPTIINLDKNFTEDTRIILNKILDNYEINNDEYLTLVKCINNSIVGVSKLLHFIQPKKYPIFDSRIKNYFKTNNLLHSVYKHTTTKEKDIFQYQIFRSLCMEIICNDRFKRLQENTISKLGINKELTPMRLLENLFFYFGKR